VPILTEIKASIFGYPNVPVRIAKANAMGRSTPVKAAAVARGRHFRKRTGLSSSPPVGWYVSGSVRGTSQCRHRTLENDQDKTEVADDHKCRFPRIIEDAGKWAAKDDSQRNLSQEAGRAEPVC
jgi:hypothetical protein